MHNNNDIYFRLKAVDNFPGLLQRKKHCFLGYATMSYGFENQISAFCDCYILFCTFFCQGTFFVTVGFVKI